MQSINNIYISFSNALRNISNHYFKQTIEHLEPAQISFQTSKFKLPLIRAQMIKSVI